MSSTETAVAAEAMTPMSYLPGPPLMPPTGFAGMPVWTAAGEARKRIAEAIDAFPPDSFIALGWIEQAATGPVDARQVRRIVQAEAAAQGFVTDEVDGVLYDREHGDQWPGAKAVVLGLFDAFGQADVAYADIRERTEATHLNEFSLRTVLRVLVAQQKLSAKLRAGDATGADWSAMTFAAVQPAEEATAAAPPIATEPAPAHKPPAKPRHLPGRS
jgi:hypothetical protein